MAKHFVRFTMLDVDVLLILAVKLSCFIDLSSDRNVISMLKISSVSTPLKDSVEIALLIRITITHQK